MLFGILEEKGSLVFMIRDGISLSILSAGIIKVFCDNIRFHFEVDSLFLINDLH